MNKRSEQYVQYLIDTVGDYSSITGIETIHPEQGLVLAVQYQDYPEEGLLTGFTYGLSEASHAEWKGAKPELTITVESKEESWVTVLAQLVEWNRNKHPFLPGSLFYLGKPIAADSQMDSFLIFNNAIDSESQFQRVDLGSEAVTLYGAHPLYHGEIKLIQKVGIRKFMGLREYSLLNVQRPDLSQLYRVGE